MNFKELAERLRTIEEAPEQGMTTEKPRGMDANPELQAHLAQVKKHLPQPQGMTTDIPTKEDAVDECGGMEVMPHGQTDSVTMSVNMNGNGAGGIKDLMDIIRNIENASQQGSDNGEVDIVLGKEDMLSNPEQQGAGAGDESIEHESFSNAVQNASGQHTYGIDAVTATGDDMHSKGSGALKHNGGENPMREGLLAQLASLYQEVKSR